MLSLRCLFTAKAALLALALLGAPALAQGNPTCPTAPAGDSTNKCASTAFVSNQIASGLPLTNQFVYVGNSSNIATGRAISGDCTITNLGVLTCPTLNGVSPGTLFPLNAAPAGTLTGTVLNATVVTSSLTSVGTLTSGATGAGFTVNLTTSTISGALPAANFPALTGDVTTPGGSLATTLATVNSNVGAFGGANSIPSFTVNGKGLITAAAANVPSIPFTELTGQATYAQLPTGSALAVLGRSANSSGVYADIQCTAAGGGVVKESSSTITCATIIDANISSSAAVAYSKLANAGANTVLSNWTAGSAALVANTWPACASDGGHALTYTNGTGVLCTVIPAGGTVTQVVCGTGLDGGTINVSGTCSLSAARRTLPTMQVLTSGTGATYTTPANVLWIEVWICGSGGGGGGITNGTPGSEVAGTAGNDSIFNSIHAAGGGAAQANSGASVSLALGGAGGTGGTGSATFRQPGSPGQAGYTSAAQLISTMGGSSFCGGGALGPTTAANGVNAAANSGGGGSGAIGGSTNNNSAGSGGGGEMAYLLITSPAGTYTYTVGASAAGGVGGNFTGGASGSGVIRVLEHYGS